VPAYSYKGRNVHGELLQGVLEGADSGAVADHLFNVGITPIEIVPAGQQAAPGVDWLSALRRGRVDPLEIMLFSRQMHTLLKAGVPILRALVGMRQSSRNPAFVAVLADIHDSLDKGLELSTAMQRHPRLFPQFYVSMVRVGEMTGRLDEIFLRLFEHMEFERKMRGQIKGALRYPTFVISAMVAAVVILNIFVIPTFAKVYKGLHTELPTMTRMLIAVSDFSVHHWPALLGGAVAAAAMVIHYVRTPEGRYRWDKLKLRLPVAGSIIFKATMGRFARSFALAGKSGVPMVQAFTVVAQVVENSYIAQRIEQMRDGVQRGESVLQTALATGVFSPVELQMIAVGEETGELDDLMMEVARMYESDVEHAVANLSAQIEPILLIGLGVLVLVMALGVFLPMWDLGAAAIKRA
jgi:MSHA biogenesis protein MshG